LESFKGSRILVTGGTGSLGQELVRKLAGENHAVVYSRNEERQYLMKQRLGAANVSYFIGDVRDQETVEYAMRGCDYVIHAAAMKDLIMCEAQPTQTYLNNVEGSKAVIRAARNIPGIKKVVAVSTDKAASPSSVYGCSKYIMEKLFEEADRVSDATFLSVRFGNMVNSSGSLISVWKENPQMHAGIKLTHPEIARFFFTISDGADTVLQAMAVGQGGEVFIKKMKKARIINILREITGRQDFEIMGLFPGEKVHEELVSQNEVHYCFEFGDYYVLRPSEINPNPPLMFSTENAVEFSLPELRELLNAC
jgi:UDP-N-acetylglucosamine 4,6-dehydratase/5-epimerase